MDILVLDDGYKGNFNQSYGIATSFASSHIQILRVSLKGPSYRLFRRKGFYPLYSKVLAIICSIKTWSLGKRLLKIFWGGTVKIPEKTIDIVISAGATLAPVNLILAKNIKNAKSVNIMVPSLLPLKSFDFLVVPYHDYLRMKKKKLKNLIVTLGAPNCLTDDFLKQEKERLSKVLRIDGSKRTLGVLIGGDDQNYTVSLNFIQKLIGFLFNEKQQYNFIFTTSRRTSLSVVKYLQEYIKKQPSVIYSEFPDYSEVSFYPGILSLCDFILVTEDSINMISEAASIGVPVVILGVERKNRKKLIFDFTIAKLVEKGYAEYITEEELNTLHATISLANNRVYRKLRESEKCAQEISKNLM